jgi:hypothetical protein
VYPCPGPLYFSLCIPSFSVPISQEKHTNKRINAENFLPKIDGSTITLARLRQHLAATRVHAMLLGPENGMHEYAGARLFGTFGVPLKVYPGLKIK